MDCHHCSKRLTDPDEFDVHKLWHTARQHVLNRPPGRNYRTRYKTKHEGPEKNAPLPPGLPWPPPSSAANSPMSPIGRSISSLPAPGQKLEPFRRMQEILHRYPAYDVDEEMQVVEEPGLKCRSCDAVFTSMKDYNEHYLSRYCPGSAAVAYVMIFDETKPGGYRTEKKIVHFDGRKSKFECAKCDGVFDHEIEMEHHEESRTICRVPKCFFLVAYHGADSIHSLECLHCAQMFTSKRELDTHYDWHDDMEYRHHRDTRRAQSADDYNLRPKTGRVNLRMNPVPKGSSLDKLGVRRMKFPAAPDSYVPRSQGDIVAVSFISAEDLERVNAPDGFFQEPSDFYLMVPRGIHQREVLEVMDEFDGNMLVVGGGGAFKSYSQREENNFDTRGYQDEFEEAPQSPQSPVSPSTGLNRKQSKFRGLFRKRQKSDIMNDQSDEWSLARSSTYPVAPITPTDLDSVRDLRGLVDISASKGDFESLRLQNERYLKSLNTRPLTRKGPSEPGIRSVTVQIHGTPGGVLINDASGRARWITEEALALINDGLQDSERTASARAKSSALCQRANVSAEKGELKDAVWSWQQVLDLFREAPTIDPDGGFQLIVLNELAQIYNKMGNPLDAENCWLDALERSQVQFGRDNSMNFMFINHLAVLYEKQGRSEDAVEMYRRSTAGRLKLLGPDHKDTILSQYALGTICIKLGDLRTGLKLYDQVLPGFEKADGSDDLKLLNMLDDLSSGYHQLQMRKETNERSGRMISRALLAVGPDSLLTAAAVSRYLQTTDNFDFPEDIGSILQHYRETKLEDGLAVLHDLGKAYMEHGLLRSGVEILISVFADLTVSKGETHQDTLNALQDLCLCLENLDVFDRAIQTLTNLQQLASRARGEQAHPYEKLAKDRIASQRQKQARVNQEWHLWDMDVAGLCHAPECTNMTTSLCSVCNIPRYCSSTHATISRPDHLPTCIPSTTLAGSRSVIPSTPAPPAIISRSRTDFLSTGIPSAENATLRSSYAFTMNPRNFTTFRLKLSPSANTSLLFAHDADIRFTLTTVHPLQWVTPTEQDHVLLAANGDEETYLLVTPGEEMLAGMVGRRRALRRADCADEMEVPDEGLVEFCQGLMVHGEEGDGERVPFMWMVEWDF